MAEHQILYQRAFYYDILFDRDVRHEVDFMVDLFQRHTGRALSSVVEIACGPGYHAREFARRGILATGLDLRPEMVAFAQDKDAAEGLELDWVIDDMRNFHLETPVDMAFIVFDGIDALLANDDLVRHLQAVAANLAPEGLYLIDLTHPRDCNYEAYGSYRYTGERDGTTVELLWATNQPHFDRITGIASVDVEMRVGLPGGERLIITDTATERMLMPQEIILLADQSGVMKVVDWYGDFDRRIPLDAPQARRMISLLQKRG